MRILMLGWEFPPSIAGGLGVACYGLTRALDRQGCEVLFVLPRVGASVAAEHVTVLNPQGEGEAPRPTRAPRPRRVFARTELREVAAGVASPYGEFSGHVPGEEIARARLLGERERGDADFSAEQGKSAARLAPAKPEPSPYGGDLIQATNDYARLVVSLARGERFDVVHAHDWPTFTAGIAIARVADRPLVVHVHSTEVDRSGEDADGVIFNLERRGMFAADRVIAVSALTKTVCARQYGVNPGKIDIVYNGIDREDAQPAPGARIEPRDRIVLFLGRITQQKGPEYFIAAAQRVAQKMRNVKFVVAGSGDLATRMMELAAEAGIAERVLFTGFLRGGDVERIYSIADCYVMPSVSEPFGLAALEAIQHGVPVIISKQSGVSEVLAHALKVDFWDTEAMADRILAVLRRPALGQTLREHGELELRRLTWERSAEECLNTYDRAIREHGAPVSYG